MQRPHKSDIDIAANLFKVHTNPMEVLVFKVYEWKINDEEMAARERNTKFRKDVFLPAVIKGLRDRSWAKEYELAFARLGADEKAFWEDINGDKVRNAWVKVVSLIWYALDVENGGDFSRSDIADRYNVNPGIVTRYVNKITSVVAYEAGPEREKRTTEIPLPLDYESDTAQAYYTDDERRYYMSSLKRYATNEGEFDLTNPIIADIIHQLIVNSYAMQRLNREITGEGKGKTNPVLVKRLTELQDSNAKTTKELIGLQKELGKLERNEESLGALKRRYVAAKEERDVENETAQEAKLFEMTKNNSRYLGFVS